MADANTKAPVAGSLGETNDTSMLVNANLNVKQLITTPAQAIAAGDLKDLNRLLNAETLKHTSNIPEALMDKKAWLCWKVTEIKADGKFNKIPVYPSNGRNRQGTQGSPEDLDGLGTYDQAIAALKRNPSTLAGMGFAALPQFGIVALDIDGCIKDSVATKPTAELAEDTYAELSPSGKGLRAFYLGEANDGKNHSLGVELFHRAGFVTVTGQRFKSSQADVAELTPEHRLKLEEAATATKKASPARAVEHSLDILSPRQIDDAREILNAMRDLNLHIAEDPWHQIIGCLAPYGKVGFELANEFSVDGNGYTEKVVRDKIRDKLRSGSTGIGRLMDIAEEYGIPNPASARSRAGGVDEIDVENAKVILDDVIANIEKDIGCAFTDAAIRAFALVREQDPAQFQRVMLALKRFGVKTEINKAITTLLNKAKADAVKTHHGWTCELSARLGAEAEPVAVRGMFYHYDAGLWAGETISVLSSTVAKLFDGNGNCDCKTDYKAIASHAIDLYEKKDFFDDAPIGIAVGNTFYSCSADGIIEEPLGPQHRQTARIPYVPVDMPTPLFDKFLYETFITANGKGADRIALMQEIMGATLLRIMYRYQKAVLMYDPFGRAGKGVTSKIISKLIPEDMTTAVALDKWGKEYDLAAMSTSWLNMVGEISFDSSETANFKNVVGNDTVTGRHIYGSPFKFKVQCSQVFSGNNFPKTRDHSDAFFNRWLIVRFPNSRSALNLTIDPHVADNIIASEMGGIVSWALAGGLRLLTTGAFTVTTEHDKLIGEWRNTTDSLQSFVDSQCSLTADARVKKADLYRAYKNYCLSEGLVAMSAKTAYGRLMQNAKLRIGEVQSKGVDYFKNIALLSDFVSDF